MQFYDFNTRQKDLHLLRVGNFIYLILESVTRRSGPSVPMLCRESMKNYVVSLKGIVFSKKTAISHRYQSTGKAVFQSKHCGYFNSLLCVICLN